MIRRIYAKSFSGFATRMISKITALTVIQWINKRSGLFNDSATASGNNELPPLISA